ncbi:DUF2794 domain-containing protein [Parvularcula marina]|uniref:DUF2794 domain-containing protein n=1 Tax=Parvularcula marina TaxID=2292771 RepID=UPI00351504D5
MSMTQSPSRGRQALPVNFERVELDAILNVYGFFVAAGEWKDYAIDGLTDRAVFSIFRRTAEAPLYRVEKIPKLRNKQGMYQVIAMTGQVLKRGSELRQVLSVFDRQKLKLIK